MPIRMRHAFSIPWLSNTMLSIWFTYIHPCMLVHHANIIQYLKPPASRKRSHVDWPKHVPNIHRGTATSQPRLHSGVRHRMGSGGTFPMAPGKSTSKASVEGSVEGYVLWIFNFQSYVSYVLWVASSFNVASQTRASLLDLSLSCLGVFWDTIFLCKGEEQQPTLACAVI
jgi:hypothetical protein